MKYMFNIYFFFFLMEAKMPRAHQRHNVALEFPFLRFLNCDLEMVKASLTFDLLPSGPSSLRPLVCSH